MNSIYNSRFAKWLLSSGGLPAIIFLLLALSSLSSSSYFLHFDTPTQQLEAIDFLLGCWGTGSGKPMIALLLAIPLAISGINPLAEMVLLSGLSAVALVALFHLLETLTHSRRWAMLGTLWFLSLPLIFYYTRIHLGYPLVFFILGVALQSKHRFAWAGIAFGIAYTSHSNYLVPLVFWVGWSVILSRQSGYLRSLVNLLAGIMLPIILIEAIRFLFHGEPLGWSLDVIRNIFLQKNVQADVTWLHVWEIVRSLNGTVNAVLLLLGLAYPFVRKPRILIMDIIFLTGFSIISFYTLRASFFLNTLSPRMIAVIYPLMVVSSIFVIKRLFAWLNKTASPSIQTLAQLSLTGLIVFVLPISIIQNTLLATVASRTAYPIIAQTMLDAAEADLPVRYFGNYHVLSFFSIKYQVESSANERSLDIITGDTRAVLIFEDFETQTALLLDERFDSSLYTITRYPHFAEYPPRLTDQYMTTDFYHSLKPVTRPSDISYAELEIWWPRVPQGTFTARAVASSDDPITYYPGSGCGTPKHFGYGSKNYYDLIFEKIREWLIP